MGLYNLIRMTSATTGTGDLLLDPTPVSGFLHLSDTAAVENVELLPYTIRDGGDSEAGLGGFYISGGDYYLFRDTVLASTNGGSLINCSGSQEVALTYLVGTQVTKSPVCWHDQSLVIAGNSLYTAIEAGQPYCHFLNQNPGANFDQWKNSFTCQAGTYTFYALGIQDTDCGKLDIAIDDNTLGTLDWYTGSYTPNVVLSIGSIVLSEGYHVLKGTVNGKNGSSSAYRVGLTKMWLTPSAF